MKVAVCVKNVPEQARKIDPGTKRLDRSGEGAISPFDVHAVEDPRDVGVFMARNPFPLVIPCHRVVASDGLGGFGGGLELKKRLLELEGVLPPRLDLGDV